MFTSSTAAEFDPSTSTLFGRDPQVKSHLVCAVELEHRQTDRQTGQSLDATLGLGHYGYRSPEPYAALGERGRHEGYMGDMETSGHWNVRLQLDTAWVQAPNKIAMSFAHEGMHQVYIPY